MADVTKKSGHLVRDEGGAQIPVAGQFQCEDRDGANDSPLAVSNSEIRIKVPAGALVFIAKAITNAIRVGPATSHTTGYDVLAADERSVFPCSKLNSIYVVRDSADGVLQYRFEVLK